MAPNPLFYVAMLATVCIKGLRAKRVSTGASRRRRCRWCRRAVDRLQTGRGSWSQVRRSAHSLLLYWPVSPSDCSTHTIRHHQLISLASTATAACTVYNTEVKIWWQQFLVICFLYSCVDNIWKPVIAKIHSNTYSPSSLTSRHIHLQFVDIRVTITDNHSWQECCTIATITARCAAKVNRQQPATPPPQITWLSVNSIQPDVMDVLGVGGWPLGFEEQRCWAT